MRSLYLILVVLVCSTVTLFAQDNVGIGTLTPNPNAALDVESNDKGLLIPRLDPAQRAAIQLGLGAAETGLLVFDPVDELFYYWDNTQAVWVPFSDDQNIDSVVLNADTTLTVYIENGASATVDVRPLINDPDFDPTNEIQDLAMNATLDSLLISLGGTGVALTDLDRQDLIYDAIADSLLITNGAGIALDSIDNQGIDSFSISGTVLTVHIENGSPASIDLAGLPTIQDLDSAILNPDSTLTIYIEAALPTTVDLSSLFDNTDAQTLSLNATGTELSISNGNTVTLVDADSTNELQDLSLNPAGDSLLISNGQGILLSGIDNQNIDSFVLNADSTLTVFIQDGSSATVDVSSLFDNTDDQNITSVILNGDSTITVNIENGTSASVDVSSLFDNTDDQDITSVVLNADSTLTVNIENGASATVDLSSVFDNTDNQNIDSVVLNGTVATVFIEDGSSASVDLASLIDDADADPTNEFQNLSFNGSGDSLLISNGTGVELTGIDNQNIDSVILNADSTITVFIEDGLPATVNVASLFDNTDAQTLSLNATGTELSISNGNTVTLVDADSTNELQSLLVDRITDSLYISGLNGDTLMGIDLNDVITCVIPPQNLTYAIMDGDTLEIDIEGGDSVRVDLSQFLDNTDNQDITSVVLNADSTITVNIQNGASATVDVAAIFDNTDDQNLDSISLAGTVATVFIEGGASASIDLASLVDDADADPTNELQDLSFNGAGDSLLISNGLGVALSGIDNQDITSIVLNGDSSLTVNIEDGASATVDLTSLFDNTDDQDITSVVLNADSTITVNIENGASATVDVSSAFDNTDDQNITSVVLNADSTITVNIENGTSATVDISSAFDNTDDQNITSVVLNADSTITVNIENGTSATVDISSAFDNTDDQNITSVVLNADSTLTVNIENGSSATVDLTSAFDNTDDQNIDSVVLNGTLATVYIEGGSAASVDLASLIDDADADATNELNTGVVLNGTDLEVTDAGGTITTDLASLVDDADADPTNELQDLSINAANDSILISNGQGISLGSLDTDDQNLDSAVLNTDSTLSIFIQDGTSTSVDLSSVFDNTDAQTLSLNAIGTELSISNGNTVTLVDADSTNELQTLLVDRITDSLYISGSNGDTLMGIDLNDVITCVIPPQNLTYAIMDGDTLEIDIEGGDSVRVDLSQFLDNTDNQDITSVVLNADSTITVNIQNGASATVDVAAIFDNTDDQNLDSISLAGTVATVFIEGGASASIDLASLVDDADADPTNELTTSVILNGTDLEVTDAGGTITTNLSSLVDDADADPTNELTSGVVLNGTDLEVTDAGGTITTDLSSLVDDADADPINELTTGVVLNGTDLEVTDAGGTITTDLSSLVDDADADPTNELNTGVALNGTDLEVTDAGGTITTDLSSLVDDADADPNNELTTGVVLNGTDLEVTDAGGTITTDLSSLVDDADADPTNEYNTSVVLNGTDLEVTDAGGIITTDLSSLVDDADADPANELQDLSINATSDSILISNGLGIPAGGIPLSAVDTDEQNLDSATLTGTNLTVYIENGSSAGVDLGPLQDADWFVEGGGDVATSINQNIYTNGFVGIGNNAPGLTLDIAGDIAFRETASNTTTSPITNFAAGTLNTSFYTFNGQVSDFTINTIAQPSDGKVLVLQNATSFNMTLINESASAIGVAIRTMTGSDLTLTGQSTVTLIYSASENRWIVLAFQDETTLDADAQTLTLTNDNQLSISNGNTVTMVDADSTNELQTLIVDRITDSLYISGTSGDTLMGIDLNDVITCVIPPQNLTYANLIGDTLEIDIEGGDSVRVDLSSLGSNDLDDAYDQGGPGVGRIIQADSGPVEIIGGDGIMVSTNGVGIGTPIPNIPNGTSVMYYSPTKGAFRAGGTANNRWDDASVGLFSWAGGSNSLASAPYTFAWGNGGSASAENAISLGAANTVFGLSSIALGTNNQIGGSQSVILGTNNRIDEFNTVILGPDNYARRRGSIIIGEENTTNGNFEYVIGADNIVSRTNGIVVGFNNVSASEFGVIIGSDNSTSNLSRSSYVLGNNMDLRGSSEVGLGQFNNINVPFSQLWDVRDRLFTIGNGQNAGTRSNAMTILKSGNVGLGNTTEGQSPPNLLTLDNGAADPLKINNLVTDNTLSQVLVIDANGVVHAMDISSISPTVPGGANTPNGLGVADINTLQQTIQQQQGQIDALIQQNQDLLFRLEQLELGNNPTNP